MLMFWDSLQWVCGKSRWTTEVYCIEAHGMTHAVAFGPSKYFWSSELFIYEIILDAQG